MADIPEVQSVLDLAHQVFNFVFVIFLRNFLEIFCDRPTVTQKHLILACKERIRE